MKKSLVALSFAALLLFPGLVSAATVSELQAKLQMLLSQVEQVRKDLSVAEALVSAQPTPRGALCVELTRALFLGASDRNTNGEVSILQKVLAEDRTLYPEGLVTGYFGPATQAAVKRLQEREGIVAPGVSAGFGSVGVLTRAFLASRCTGASSSSGSSTAPRPSMTESLQSALATIALDTMPAFTSNTPTLSGSAKNLTSVSVEVRSSEVVYSNTSVPVKDGRWSATTSALTNGSYQVIVKGGSGAAIAVGFVIVEAPVVVVPSTPKVSTDTTLKVVAPALVSKVVLRLNGSDKGTTLSAGSKVLLSWSTENVSSCAFVSNPPIEISGSVLSSEFGKSSGSLFKTTVFTLTCIGADGTFVSHSLTANVVL